MTRMIPTKEALLHAFRCPENSCFLCFLDLFKMRHDGTTNEKKKERKQVLGAHHGNSLKDSR